MFNPSGYCGAKKIICHHGKNNKIKVKTSETAINNEETTDNFLVVPFMSTSPFL
jgi:hypothetical protein